MRFAFRPEAHAKEHAIEVQLPFVQVLFPQARILPMIIGTQSPALCRHLGEELATLLGERKALVVASSDLSHYPRAADAVSADAALLAPLAARDTRGLLAAVRRARDSETPGLQTSACGLAPLLATLEYTRRRGAGYGHIVSYAHSGETPLGDPLRVVGYGAVAFHAGPGAPDLSGLERPSPSASGTPLTRRSRRALLRHARAVITGFMRTGQAPLTRELPRDALQHAGAFVTLKDRQGRLRGCIGHMHADRPLAEVIAAMSLKAAFADPRFPPVTPEEFRSLELEISVLTPERAVASPEAIRLGQHGIVLIKEERRAVFLPQVPTENGWTLEETLAHLAKKAGLPSGAWRDGATLRVFEARVFSE